MLRDVPPASKLLKRYCTLPASGFCTLTPKMQSIIAEADKPNKGGNKGGKKGEKKKEDTEGPFDPKNTPKKRKAKAAPSAVTPKKRKLKRSARKSKSPTPYESEQSQSDTQLDVTPTYNDFFPTAPRSPEHTTTLITITSCPPPVYSQHQSTIPLSIPLLTDSIVPPTTSGESVVLVNASDAVDRTLGFTSSHIYPPISLIHRDDTDMILRDDEDDLAGFTFSSFTIRTASDDQTSIMKGQQKAIHEKLDSLLQTSKPSSSYD
ncbi:unnamed protein product [Lactuca saligna]|uniref:Uncharacterized protein n=1 Tax=Lactuca saligna TaxID=75948 RepID=A0AA36A2C7_LACSI|nr:unnamed protein product [Lactuca saligna]